MPRKTIRVVRPSAPVEQTVEEIINEGLEPTQEEIEKIEDGRKVAEFQQSFGGKNYKIRVERFNKEDAEWEIIPQLFLLDSFDPIVQLRPYAPGRFRLTLLNEKSKYVDGGREYIRIAASVETAKKEDSPRSAFDDPVVRLMIENMKADKTSMTDLLKTVLARPTDAPKAPGVAEMIDSLARLKTLSPQDDGGFKKIKEMAELMTLLKTMQGDASEGPSGEGLMSDILQAVKIMKETGMMNRQNPPATAVPPQPQIIKDKIIEEPPMKNPIAEGVEKYIPLFTSWAKRGADIEITAEFLIDELNTEIVPLIVAHYRPGGMSLTPEFVLQNLIDKSQDPVEINKIFQFAPALLPYRSWVELVITQAVKELTSSDNEAETDKPAETEA